MDADGLRFRDEFFGGDVLDRASSTSFGPCATLHHRHHQQLHGRTAAPADACPRRADAFDLIVVSAQERIMKPDAEIFQRTLSRLNLRPEEIVFIDDFAWQRRRRWRWG
ncbi:MAG: HAD-IA family hydrolase [Caldilineaceae bacterium]